MQTVRLRTHEWLLKTAQIAPFTSKTAVSFSTRVEQIAIQSYFRSSCAQPHFLFTWSVTSSELVGQAEAKVATAQNLHPSEK